MIVLGKLNTWDKQQLNKTLIKIINNMKMGVVTTNHKLGHFEAWKVVPTSRYYFIKQIYLTYQWVRY